MGLEIVFGIASLAVGVIQGINSANAAAEQTKAAEKIKKVTEQSAKTEKKAAEAQKRANEITVNKQKIGAIEDRRQRLRELRVRSAQMEQASVNQGAGGSSGESGAISSLGANFGTLLSQGASESRGNAGINYYSQKALDLDNTARFLQAKAGIFRADANLAGAQADQSNAFLGIFGNAFSSAGSIFHTANQPVSGAYP